jgi:ribonuclease VapC
VIAIDSSALVAVAMLEPDWKTQLGQISQSEVNILSAVNYVETGTILIHRGRFADRPAFDEWLAAINVQVETDAPDRSLALQAYLDFGKGRHPARLNLGDCFAYALARSLDAPLLFKGDDFARTDIRSALQPT